MFFVLSKTLGILLEPLFLPYFCLTLALLARWRKRIRLMRILIVTAICLPGLYGFLPLSSLPLQVLENRIPRAELPSDNIDGIIVLGGFTANSQVAESRGTYGLIHSAERFTAALELAQNFPEAPVLFSGFSGQLVHKGWTEADHIRDLLSRIGEIENALFEEESRNTYENAENSHKLLAPTPGSNWVVVTSAFHMPRAVGCFEAAGWTGIVPHPVDYKTPKNGTIGVWSLIGISHLRIALHEYVGLIVYATTGRSSSVLPG